MPVGTAEAEPLNELMLAMDVVDTLRHRELMLEREVEAEIAISGCSSGCGRSTPRRASP